MSEDQNQNSSQSKIVKREHNSERKFHKVNYLDEQNIAKINIQLAKNQNKVLKFDNLLQSKGFSILITLVLIILFNKYRLLVKDNNNYDLKIEKLQKKIADAQSSIQHLKQQIQPLKEEIYQLYRKNQKLTDLIIDLHQVELDKQQKSMNILQKYSELAQLKFQENGKKALKNYVFNQMKQSIRKISNEQVILYSTIPISQDHNSYFKIKIQKTIVGMISIGIFTQQKLTQNLECGYCQGNEMYYLYIKNGQVYHGQTLQYKHSKNSRFSKIKAGDTVSVFTYPQHHQLIWYVNGKYASSWFLQQKMTSSSLYPFIIMGSKGDEVIILE